MYHQRVKESVHVRIEGIKSNLHSTPRFLRIILLLEVILVLENYLEVLTVTHSGWVDII